MIDPTLSGLINLPDTGGPGANCELIAGLARFGASLAGHSKTRGTFRATGGCSKPPPAHRQDLAQPVADSTDQL